jgi:hypothetical protein
MKLATGLTLAVSTISMVVILTQFMMKYNDKAGLSFPQFNFNKGKLEKALGDAKDLDAYFDLLKWDNLFALAYGITFFILLQALSVRKWYLYTVPLHVVLDFVENGLAKRMVEKYQETQTAEQHVVFGIVSSLKWSLAYFNMGMIILLGAQAGVKKFT